MRLKSRKITTKYGYQRESCVAHREICRIFIFYAKCLLCPKTDILGFFRWKVGNKNYLTNDETNLLCVANGDRVT
jgi:hypothetical protein